MQSKYKNVLFVAESGNNARPYYRANLPSSGLVKNGYNSRVCHVLYEQENHYWNGWAYGPTDIRPTPKFIILHTMLTPNEKGELVWQSQKEIVKAIREKGQVVLFDLDDDIWNIPEWNPQYNNSEGISGHLDEWVEDINASDGLICSTISILGSAKLNGITVPIWTCPNSIDYYNYKHHLDHHPLRVGWFGDISFRGKDFEIAIEDLYKAFHGRRHEVEFWHIGTDFDQSIRHLLPKFPVDIIEQPWHLPEFLPNAVSKIDIGIIPAAKHVFNEGRSNVVGLCFAAGGVSFLASPTVEYNFLDSKVACVADNFSEALVDLIEDTEFRYKWRKQAAQVIPQWWAPKIIAQNYEGIFEECLKKQ